MPIYEYENLTTGEIIEAFRPVRRRNVCPPNTVRLMSRTGKPRVGKEGLADPSTADVAVPRALKQLEETVPADRIERESGFSAKTLKRVWGMK